MKKAAIALGILALGWFLGVNTFLLGLRFRWPWGSVPAADRTATTSFETADYRFMAVGASRAIVWGDAETGPYGAYTKFEPGFTAPLHHHSSDMHFQVLRGAYVYKPVRGEPRRVEAGSHIFIPAGESHECGADAKHGVVFYDVSPGRFDVVIRGEK